MIRFSLRSSSPIRTAMWWCPPISPCGPGVSVTLGRPWLGGPWPAPAPATRAHTCTPVPGFPAPLTFSVSLSPACRSVMLAAPARPRPGCPRARPPPASPGAAGRLRNVSIVHEFAGRAVTPGGGRPRAPRPGRKSIVVSDLKQHRGNTAADCRRITLWSAADVDSHRMTPTSNPPASGLLARLTGMVVGPRRAMAVAAGAGAGAVASTWLAVLAVWLAAAVWLLALPVGPAGGRGRTGARRRGLGGAVDDATYQRWQAARRGRPTSPVADGRCSCR